MKKRSFTLIEMIVVVGVIALLIPTVFAMTFALIRQQLTLYGYSELRRQGALVQQTIRNLVSQRAAEVTDATYIATDICPPLTTPTPTGAPRLYFQDKESQGFSLSQELSAPYRFASFSASTGKTYFLTNSLITIDDLSFTCYRVNTGSPPFVYASYTTTKNILDKTISLPYRVRVQVGSGYSY